MPVGEKQTHRFGSFELDTKCGQLRRDGVGLKLQGQPVQILEILLEKPGQLVTRDELRQRLWASDTFVDFDHSLNTAIKKLRQALGDEADTPRYIETLPKRGYRFIGEVEREEPKEETREAAVAVLPSGPLEPRPANRIRRWRRSVVSSFLGALVVACGVLLYSVLTPEPQPRIVGSRVLSRIGPHVQGRTGFVKEVEVRPFVERGSIYFNEKRPSGSVLLSVSSEGGEVTAGPSVNGYLADISRDGSQLLSMKDDPKRKQTDLWTQSSPAGVPRMVIRDVYDAIWSADGRSIFFTRGDDYTQLYRANEDGTGVERLAIVPNFGAPHLSPDGSRIRFTGAYPELPLWEVGANGRNLRQLLGGRKDVFGGSWSPNGKYYFFRIWDGDHWSLGTVSESHHWWARPEAARPYSLTFGPVSFGVPAISKDGRQLYAVGKEPHGELSVYDSKAGKFVPYLGGTSICYVDFSRDGQWIAYVSYPEGTLWRSRIDGSERRQLTVPPLAVVKPRWSPDGKLIAFMDLSNGDRRQMTDESPTRIYVISADGGGPELLLAGHLYDPTWSPDGKSIAYDYSPVSQGLGGSEIRILNLQTQRSTTVPGSHDKWSARWSPDGKYLVSNSFFPSTKLMLYRFDNNSWEELASGEWIGWPSWSHDSKFVYAGDGDSLLRITVSNHKKEQVASVQGFQGTAYFMDRWNQGWLGWTPDGRPIATRDTGLEEIYAFDLEYK